MKYLFLEFAILWLEVLELEDLNANVYVKYLIQ